jgi:protein-S-isoprenylcysteine O-methyltransferase Ste14
MRANHFSTMKKLNGFIVMNWAEIALGKFFSVQVTLQKNHRLITEGIYKHVRNPRYLGIITSNIGVSLVFRSWPALLLTGLLVVVLLWRIHDEEKLMGREFGGSWEAYKKRSRRLAQFIYRLMIRGKSEFSRVWQGRFANRPCGCAEHQ